MGGWPNINIGAQLTRLQADTKKVERGGMRAGDGAGRYSGPGRERGRRLPGTRPSIQSSGLARQESRNLVFFRAKKG